MISPKKSEFYPYFTEKCGLLISSIILRSEFLGRYFLIKAGRSGLAGILVSIFWTAELWNVF
jgi:hypothetical protein